MTKRWFVIATIIGAFVLGAALRKAGTTPFTRQPNIVASFHLKNISQGIPTTTLFTPVTTGVFRVSIYLAMTTPVSGGNWWTLNMNWADDAGQEEINLGSLPDDSAPPGDYSFTSTGGINPPFTFEAVAGQPVTFTLHQSVDNPPGTCGLSIVIERLQ
jgi:hypothetical protein